MTSFPCIVLLSRSRSFAFCHILFWFSDVALISVFVVPVCTMIACMGWNRNMEHLFCRMINQLHLGFSGNTTLYNARTMIDRMLLLFPCNTLYKHERWLTGLLDVMDPGADYWCFSNDFPPGCWVFPCNTLYNARITFVCFFHAIHYIMH